jgi:deazaflavin-dependent oxidoreductase (nitroreductase family)
VTTLRRIAADYLGRRPWLSTVGPRVVAVDLGLQRLTGGWLSFGRLAGMSSVLLITTGRKTGQPRRTPLIVVPDGDAFLLVASNFGRPGHPSWSANLIADPQATALIRGHPFPITAKLLTGAERATAWATATAAWPAYDDYAVRSGREIRVFRAVRR